MADYRGGNVYYALARSSGLTADPDQKHWKDNDPEMRQRMKSLQLGINYGMGVRSLAKGLDSHPLIASSLIETHRRVHPRFWEWRAQQVQNAMLDRRIETVFGWPLHLSTSPNKRTLYNFPMQGNGAEMLRLAAWRLCEAGLVPACWFTTAFCSSWTTTNKYEHANEIMRWAGREVCNGFEIDVEVDQKLIGGARYCDKRPKALEMWATIMDVLESIGVIPRGRRRRERHRQVCHAPWPTYRGWDPRN